jgi:hypothetical protein
MILRPVTPFEAALTAAGSISMSNADAVAASYDSSDSSKSTSGLYDSTKRQSKGHVRTNGSTFTFNGSVHGDIGTNGGNVAAATRFNGAIDNNANTPLVSIQEPSWSTSTSVVGTANNSQPAGITAPTRVKITGDLTGNLTVTSTGVGAIDIWITGDLKGKLTLPANVTARVFVGGNIDVRSGDLANQSNRAENLQIYGLQPAANATPPTIRIRLDAPGNASSAGTYAGIYAPGHKVELTNNGDFFGSLTALDFQLPGERACTSMKRCAAPAGSSITAASWVEYIP